MAVETDPSVRPDNPEDGLVLYVKKASPTSTANSVKPLMMIEALKISHHIHIINSTSNETCFHAVNPYKMVPALEDTVVDPATGTSKRVRVFDSSSCLAYLVERYDKDGIYGGRDIVERTEINNWLFSYTAGLGATGKTWLLMKMPKDVDIGESLSVLLRYIRNEYDFLEARLKEPGQNFVAIADRPTVADFAILPLANDTIAKSADLDFNTWPRLKAWSERVAVLEPVAAAMHRIARFGLSEEELKGLES